MTLLLSLRHQLSQLFKLSSAMQKYRVQHPTIIKTYHPEGRLHACLGFSTHIERAHGCAGPWKKIRMATGSVRSASFVSHLDMIST
jgi:hypothetical protein